MDWDEVRELLSYEGNYRSMISIKDNCEVICFHHKLDFTKLDSCEQCKVWDKNRVIFVHLFNWDCKVACYVFCTDNEHRLKGDTFCHRLLLRFHHKIGRKIAR